MNTTLSGSSQNWPVKARFVDPLGHNLRAIASLPPQELSYGLREDLRFFVSVVRARFFVSVWAVISLVLDTSFLDRWTISASFAFTRLVISRLSPVFGMCPPYETMSRSLLFERWRLLPVLQKFDLLSDRRGSALSSASDLRSTERSKFVQLSPQSGPHYVSLTPRCLRLADQF